MNTMPKIPKSKFNIDEITIVLIVSFIAIFASVYSNKINDPINSNNANKVSDLGAEQIADMLFDGHAMSFVSSGVVNENKFKEIQEMNYEDLKSSLNAKNDFCIYIEDENGNVLLAKGSSKLREEGIFCNE